jgi:hypothetical protein
VLASSLLAAKDFATNPTGSKLAKAKASILRIITSGNDSTRVNGFEH